MLLCTWLEFLKSNFLLSTWHPNASQATWEPCVGEEKRPSGVEHRIFKKPLLISIVQNGRFPNTSHSSYDLLQLAKVVLSPFHDRRNSLSKRLSDLPVVTCLIRESPKLFKCSAPYSCIISTNDRDCTVTETVCGCYLQWLGSRSHFEEIGIPR